MDWSNKVWVLKVMTRDGRSLRHASTELRNDRDKIVIYNNFNISCSKTSN